MAADLSAAGQSPAVETIVGRMESHPVVLTCEHASNVLPPPWTWPEADQRLVQMHWAYDLGIAQITRQVAHWMGCPAVLSRFSRLLIDPNRPLDSDTLFRTIADGQPVMLNAAIDPDDAKARVEGFYKPYHAAVGAMLQANPEAAVVSLHSYTPLYEGSPREVEVGILFDQDEAWARRWLQGWKGSGYDVRLQEPYSGALGMMYSPQHHATLHKRPAVELELRQDLAEGQETYKRLAAWVCESMVSSTPGLESQLQGTPWRSFLT